MQCLQPATRSGPSRPPEKVAGTTFSVPPFRYVAFRYHPFAVPPFRYRNSYAQPDKQIDHGHQVPLVDAAGGPCRVADVPQFADATVQDAVPSNELPARPVRYASRTVLFNEMPIGKRWWRQGAVQQRPQQRHRPRVQCRPRIRGRSPRTAQEERREPSGVPPMHRTG